MHRGFRNMSFSMTSMWIIPIILIVIIAIAVYMIAKNKREKDNPENNSALNILNERFAKGEIDEEEYTEMKKNISNLK